MARRLALLAFLACAVTSRPPSNFHQLTSSNSDTLDTIALWADLDDLDSDEIPPRFDRAKHNAKVIIRNNIPELNITRKTSKSDSKNKVIKTTINIESHTNFIVTKRPVVVTSSVTLLPEESNINDEVFWVDGVAHTPRPITRKTAKPKSSTTRRPSTTRRSQTSTKKQKATTRRSTTRTTRSSLTTRATKATKSPKTKVTCATKKPGRVPSLHQDNKVKEKPVSSGWFVGIFSSLYNWFVESKTSWFSSNWFIDDSKITTTTTPSPPSTSTGNWFETFLDSEDVETTPATETIKKSASKSLKKNYKGYQLIRAYPDVLWKVHSLLDLKEEAEGSGLMWWTSPSLNGSTDLLVPPDLLVDIKDSLKSSKIEFDVVIWDLQKAISYENPKLSKKQRIELEQLRGHPMTWRRYHRYSDIMRYLDYLQHSYSDIVELIPLGLSSEGLPLVAVKVSLPRNETIKNNKVKRKYKLKSQLKPAVWLEGGAHAREWIAPAVALWMLHNLVEGEKGFGTDRRMLKMADFYIMPVLNPDGYEHSHTHDRLWRKTRSRSSEHSDDYYVGWFPWNWGRTECIGVDADRNWDYHWGEKDSSQDPCAENYSGPHPFSEPETRAVSQFLAENRGHIQVYISLHAYSQAWLLPSSHSHATFADDGVLMEMGKLATAALADMYGTKYQVGTAAEIRQPATGMSHDWAKVRAGIKYAYHVDLRDSYGPYGFLLPGSQIVPTARETYQALKAIVENL
ncbi:carboxypeptidase A2-like isoform X1 [Danaus plexippus]|uniref:carboxypeptidase A2-like isoform X1 n=1 Tax=Danaus plexippus TaxID=13037 RepID=UPI002AB28252|nr:carboxypeptidase A2-like isoform X1 [Danaus plexippus]